MKARIRNRKRRPGKGKTAIPPQQVSLAKPVWDRGAMGRANRHGLIEEDAPTIDPETGEEHNPNGVRRMRRVILLDVWHRKGVLSAAAYTAACDLRDAFLTTQMGPSMDMAQDRVDSSPKPDHAVAIQTDRLSRFHAIWRHVIKSDIAILTACVLDGGGPGDVKGKDGIRPYRNTMGDLSRHAAGLRHLSEALERLAQRRGS